MALKDGNGPLSMIVVVVLDKVVIRHAMFLLDVYSRFHDLSKARGVGVACLKCFGYHVVT